MGSFPTEFQWVSAKDNLAAVETDVLVVPVFQEKPEKGAKAESDDEADEKSKVLWSSASEQLDTQLKGLLKYTAAAEKFSGALGKKRLFCLRPEDGMKARWILLLGLGTDDKLNIAKATKTLCGALKETFGFEKVHHVTVVQPQASEKLTAEQFAQAVVFGATQATYKTQEAGEKKRHELKTVALVSGEGQAADADVLNVARIMALSEAMTKDLANRPANLKRAEDLAEAARGLSSLPGISVTVIDDLARIKEELPAFWAVAQGSEEVDPPRFIQVTYTPESPAKKFVALVGKGVIFDTGGVQVKTGTYMNDMKFDMTGAATVLSVIKAAAELKLPVKVTATVAATANHIGERAYLPDSIIDSASGKKIEVRHTDAEGRITLADAVYKAAQDKPDEIITIATLTGSAMLAVGHCTALMGTDDELLDRIDRTGKAVGEAIQKFELLEQDYESVKSDRDAADLSNVSKERSRGHLSAGAFVISFADDIPTAHMDIAGGDAKDGNATGIAVKGLIAYLRNEAS